MANAFTDNNFKAEVLEVKGLVLVDFWATWCGPCMMLSPIIDALAQEYEGKIKVGKVDVDQNSDVATAYGISSIPCLLLFKDGELIDRKVGAAPKAQLKIWLDSKL
ncbi:thioredoxin [Candidatus Sumerlaeota bacterium]|nr:thioredoxin [Candidatus Sumerlaeales bacterium]NLD62020.1 thioredoxin [Candidatus Sumerlaeota bacterium]